MFPFLGKKGSARSGKVVETGTNGGDVDFEWIPKSNLRTPGSGKTSPRQRKSKNNAGSDSDWVRPSQQGLGPPASSDSLLWSVISEWTWNLDFGLEFIFGHSPKRLCRTMSLLPAVSACPSRCKSRHLDKPNPRHQAQCPQPLEQSLTVLGALGQKWPKNVSTIII